MKDTFFLVPSGELWWGCGELGLCAHCQGFAAAELSRALVRRLCALRVALSCHPNALMSVILCPVGLIFTVWDLQNQSGTASQQGRNCRASVVKGTALLMGQKLNSSNLNAVMSTAAVHDI